MNKQEQFDVELGFRLKMIRQMRRMSQDQLGRILGISFQQIQKYEGGKNRMPPERIDQCAQIFDVPVSYFFDKDDSLHKFEFDQKTINVAAAISTIPCEEIRKRIYHLVLAINDNARKCNKDNDNKAA